MRRDTIPESAENTNPDMSSSDSKVIDGIIADLRITIDQLAINFNIAKNLILELARRFDETKRCEQSQICRKIKEILQDKINEGKITAKWIEECLPQGYKRRYTKSEVTSLLKQPKRDAAEQQLNNKDIIVVDAQGGKSFLTNVNGCNDNGDGDGANDNNLHNKDETKQGPNQEFAYENTSFGDYNKHQAICSENYELKQAVKRLTSIVTADKISATEIEFRIHKAKYEYVKAAMESSRDSIYITFDKSGILQHADSDIFREKLRND
jgi:hypothetical protein